MCIVHDYFWARVADLKVLLVETVWLQAYNVNNLAIYKKQKLTDSAWSSSEGQHDTFLKLWWYCNKLSCFEDRINIFEDNEVSSDVLLVFLNAAALAVQWDQCKCSDSVKRSFRVDTLEKSESHSIHGI